MSQELAEDPMSYPDAIIIYHLKIDGVSKVSVQIDTKRKLQLEYEI